MVSISRHIFLLSFILRALEIGGPRWMPLIVERQGHMLALWSGVD
jgi:hypothetical protein